MTSLCGQLCLEASCQKKIITCTVTNDYSLLTSACFIVFPVKMTVNFTRKFGSSHEQIGQFDHFVPQHYPYQAVIETQWWFCLIDGEWCLYKEPLQCAHKYALWHLEQSRSSSLSWWALPAYYNILQYCHTLCFIANRSVHQLGR